MRKLKAVAADAHLAERHDSVFMGTAVANGTGQGVVVATGMKTELGKIAHLLATAQVEATPLQKRLARVSHILLYVCLGIVALVALRDSCAACRSWKCLSPPCRWQSPRCPKVCPPS